MEVCMWFIPEQSKTNVPTYLVPFPSNLICRDGQSQISYPESIKHLNQLVNVPHSEPISL